MAGLLFWSSLIYSLLPRQSAWWLVEAGDIFWSVVGDFGGSVSGRKDVAVSCLVNVPANVSLSSAADGPLC